MTIERFGVEGFGVEGFGVEGFGVEGFGVEGFGVESLGSGPYSATQNPTPGTTRVQRRSRLEALRR